MNLKRKDFYRTMLTRPINLQLPLPNQIIPASYPTLPVYQDQDLASHFHQHYHVTNAPLSPNSSKQNTHHEVVAKLFQNPTSQKTCKGHKKKITNPSEHKKKQPQGDLMARSSSVRRVSSRKGNKKKFESRVEVRFVFHF